MSKYFFAFLFVSLFIFSLSAQESPAIEGLIQSKETKEKLPFASISLKNFPVGTISNENGEFTFYIPKSMRRDTLVVSFIGFNNYEIPVQNINKKLNISLQTANNLLDEVLVSNLSALDYIKLANEKMSENVPQTPYQTIAYYREKFIENNAVINKDEAVFKTYYPVLVDSAKNQHQLLLFRPAENPQEFQFMREWLDKQESKQRKKAEKKGEVYEGDLDEGDDNFKVDFGGPESVLDTDVYHDKDANFLNPKHFKKYEYTLGEQTSLNNESLITIHFVAKKSIDNIKDSGKILISKDNFAIVQVEQKGKFIIPFLLKPILFAIGLKISQPTFQKTVSYQKFQDQWYPKLFRWDAFVNLTKRHAFDKNETAKLNIGQVFSIISFSPDGTPIEESKKFDANEKLADQMYNDLNLQWNQINIIPD